MKRICIIPCGAKKIWDITDRSGEQLAKDVYVGTFHKLCQSYATMFFSQQWVILSAKHGFLNPTDIVPENYDLSFSMKSDSIITDQQLINQLNQKNLQDVSEVVVLGGKKYRKVVESVFKDVTFTYPLQDCTGIGFMQQRLKQAVENKKEL